MRGRRAAGGRERKKGGRQIEGEHGVRKGDTRTNQGSTLAD